MLTPRTVPAEVIRVPEERDELAERLHADLCVAGCRHPVSAGWLELAEAILAGEVTEEAVRRGAAWR